MTENPGPDQLSPPTGPAAAPVPAAAGAAAPASDRRGRLARSAIFYSIATGASRVAGLVREIAAASQFGVTGPMSAFAIAYQVPNVLRALFAEGPLQAGFVPVFTELLERGQRKEAFRVAWSLVFLTCLVLGGATALLVLLAPLVMPLLAPGFDDEPELRHLTIVLSQVLFLTVPMLAVSGLVVGILYAFDRFAASALAPLAWNLVVIGFLLGVVPLLAEDKQIYGYAFGVLAGTAVQLALPMPWLRGIGGRFSLVADWRNPHVRRVLKLMLPVTLALGVASLDLVIDSFFGTLVSEETPAAIDRAFRIYQLPQGLFSVAVATILFPTLARYAARGERANVRRITASGARQIALLLVPSAFLMAVLAEPITRLVYQRGEFTAHSTELVKTAMVWWAVALPFEGISLLYSRAFFSLQRTWVTAPLALVDIALNALVALALYGPFGISGVVIGTAVGTASMTALQALILRRDLGGVEGRATAAALSRMVLAGCALGAVSYLVWRGLDAALGRRAWAQVVSLGTAIAAGGAVYGAAVLALRVREAHEILELVKGRFHRT